MGEGEAVIKVRLSKPNIGLSFIDCTETELE